ncbi:MAG: flippase-like domain-containing protein [Bacteroidales bacterium]|nr:flippase-like domain-containing protein [Bacteroidales bacterium]
MRNKRLFRILLFLVVGILIFIYIYKDLQFKKIEDALNTLDYKWIVLSGIFGLLSHFIRALRWNLLIEPLSHKPGLINTYLAVLVLYLFNILIPRGGEVARCTVISRYEKISFTKLFGTVVSERLADLVTFFLIVFVLLLWDVSYFRELLHNNPNLASGLEEFSKNGVFFLVAAVALVIIGVVVFRRSPSRNKYRNVVGKVFSQFREGLQTIRNSSNKSLFVIYTLLIIILWLMMLYVVFFAYEPTSHLSFRVAVITFALSSFAFLLPIQAGLGAWHFIVIQSLLLFGIDVDHGSVFALVAHTFTNLIFLAAGTLAFMLLPVVNNRRAKRLKFSDV